MILLSNKIPNSKNDLNKNIVHFFRNDEYDLHHERWFEFSQWVSLHNLNKYKTTNRRNSSVITHDSHHKHRRFSVIWIMNGRQFRMKLKVIANFLLWPQSTDSIVSSSLKGIYVKVESWKLNSTEKYISIEHVNSIEPTNFNWTTSIQLFKWDSVEIISIQLFNWDSVEIISIQLFNWDSVEIISIQLFNWDSVEIISIQLFNCDSVEVISIQLFNCDSVEVISIQLFNWDSVEVISIQLFNCDSVEVISIQLFNWDSVEIISIQLFKWVQLRLFVRKKWKKAFHYQCFPENLYQRFVRMGSLNPRLVLINY